MIMSIKKVNGLGNIDVNKKPVFDNNRIYIKENYVKGII